MAILTNFFEEFCENFIRKPSTWAYFFFTYQSVFSHILFQNIHVYYPTVWISHVRYVVHVGDDFEEVFSGEAARSKSRLAFILLIYLQTPLTPTLDFDVAMVKISNMIPD